MSHRRPHDALLLFPPATVEFQYPELGMPLLTAWLRQAGWSVAQRDLNLELVRHRLGTPDHLRAILDTPGWRVVLAGPPRRKTPAGPLLDDLVRRYREDQSVHRVLYLQLSRVLALQPPSTRRADLRDWVEAPHPVLDPFVADQVADLLSPGLPRVVGLSVCSTSQLGHALRFARALRRAGCGPVVLGGPWARAARGGFGSWPELFDHLDAVAFGDGETTLEGVLEAVRDGRELAGLPGLLVRRGDELVAGPEPRRVALEQLPAPDFEGLDPRRYFRNCLPVRSRRTCPWGRCVICHHTSVRERGPETPLPARAIVDQIEALIERHGVPEVELANLATPVDEARGIAEELLRRGTGVAWSTLARVEEGFDAETLGVLAESGCRELHLGLESVAAADLQRIRKGISVATLDALLEHAAAAGVEINLFVMSFPGQRREDLERTLRYCVERMEWVASFTAQRFTLSRETQALAEPAALGVELADDFGDELDVFDLPFRAEDQVPRRTFMRIGLDHAIRFRRLKTRSPPSFWDLQWLLGGLRGELESPSTLPGAPVRPLRVLLVRANLPGARRRGIEPPPMDPPLGLLMLSSAVREWSALPHRISVVDLGIACDAPGEVLGLIAGYEPDVVGISGNNVDEDQVHLVARSTKLLYPDSPVVVGGAIASARKADLLRDPYIDLLALREGERTLPELLDTLARGGDPAEVAGLIVRDTDGSPRETGERPLIEDLDAIPLPDWDQIDLRAYRGLCNANEFPILAEVYAPIVTSRGCPWRCVFCHSFFGHRARTRSPESVLDELELLVRRHGVGEIHVHDDIFNIDGDRLEAICDGIVQRGLDLKIAFPNGLRADRLTRRHLEKLAAAGCYHMCMALESIVPRIQKLLRKHLDVDRVLENARIASELGIMPAAFVMIGLPTETREEIRANMEAVVHSHFDQLRLFVACPHPGTEMYDLAVAHGFDPSGLPPGRVQYDWERGSVNCTDLPDDEFRELIREFQRRFWSHPPRVERIRHAYEERGVTLPYDPRMAGGGSSTGER